MSVSKNSFATNALRILRISTTWSYHKQQSHPKPFPFGVSGARTSFAYAYRATSVFPLPPRKFRSYASEKASAFSSHAIVCWSTFNFFFHDTNARKQQTPFYTKQTWSNITTWPRVVSFVIYIIPIVLEWKFGLTWNPLQLVRANLTKFLHKHK